MRAMLSLIDPFDPAQGDPPRKLWPFLRWALRGAEWPIVAAFFVTLITGAAEVGVALYTGWVIDSAEAAGTGAFWEAFWQIVVVGLVFFLIIRPLIFIFDAAVSSVLLTPNLFPMVLARLNKHTLGHSMRYFENDFAGRISQKAVQTSRAVNDILVEVSDAGVYGFAMFVGAFFLMAAIDPRLLLVFVLWAATYVAVLWVFIPKIQSSAAMRAETRTHVTGQVVDTLSNIATVKLFAQDQEEDRATRKALSDFREASFRFGVITAVFRMLLMTVGGMLPIVSILGTLYLWSLGTASAGDIATTAMITSRLSMLTNRLGRLALSVFTNIGEIQDGVETLAPPHEIRDHNTATDDIDGAGAIRFAAVSFAYGGSVTALDGFDLHVEPGEKVALVGASGAGKSTVISLLLRLYDVESGQILLNNRDIREATQNALRRQISVVRQETAMFNRSALENIRYGRPDASEDIVFDAARRASAHDFIQSLRDHKGREGYNARLGERGVKLSGGQRQRIALARAILKDAPILILDEATSALDSEVEAEIQAALADVMEGKTVIAIAHRLSTIAQMDRIIVMDHGCIVEQGDHSSLLEKDGLYARYWKRQSGGFLAFSEAAE